jgi:hypothetical protein
MAASRRRGRAASPPRDDAAARITGQTATVTGPETTADGDREELIRLRAEVARLRAAADRGALPEAPRPGRWGRTGRSLLAIALIALGCLLTPLSVVSVWARGEVTDTNRYVETVAPLADDPAVQQAITTNITNAVFQYIDVQGLANDTFTALAQSDVVPPRVADQLPALAPLVANGVRSFTEDQVHKLVQSDVFATAWVEANRIAHEQLVAALTGEGDGAVQISGDAVSVNMAAFLTTVKQVLVSNGFQLAERIPAVDVQFVVFESADLPRVQRGFNLLNTLGLWMPLICVVLIGLGIYVARNHRLAFLGAGIGVTLAMLATALALAAVRRVYLEGVPADVLPADAAAVLYDSFVRFLREAIRAGVLLGLVVAAGAFLTGHSVTATALRRWIRSGFAAARGGLQRAGIGLESTTAWLAPRARVLRVSVVVVAFAILLLQRYKTPELVAWLTLGVLVAFAVIQFLATPPPPRPDEPVQVAHPRPVLAQP